MFDGCTLWNTPTLFLWDVSQVKCMDNMFRGCAAFNQPLSAWDTSSVRSMVGMFRGCTSFNQSLQDWNVANAVLHMDHVLDNCVSFASSVGHTWPLCYRIQYDPTYCVK